MGSWGTGLWSDDTACDVRAVYRAALEDGLSDDEATGKVVTEFAPDLADEDAAPVVWLALAVSQHGRGRLTADVRARALAVIDSGAALRPWEHTDSGLRARRAAVLTRARARLTDVQPPRRPVRRRPRQITTLKPGDVLAYRASSGRFHLLAIRAIVENRYGAFPLVRLLDFHEDHLPAAGDLAALGDQAAGRSSPPGGSPDPWWAVEGTVSDRRGHDFADYGFEIVGHVPAPSQAEQEGLCNSVSSHSGWQFWQRYLQKQDELLGERLTSQA